MIWAVDIVETSNMGRVSLKTKLLLFFAVSICIKWWLIQQELIKPGHFCTIYWCGWFPLVCTFELKKYSGQAFPCLDCSLVMCSHQTTINWDKGKNSPFPVLGTSYLIHVLDKHFWDISFYANVHYFCIYLF